MPTIKQYTHTASDCVFQVLLDGEVVKEFLLRDLYVTDTAQGFILSDDLYSMTFDAANTLDITAPDIRELREGCNGPITPNPPQQALKITFDDISNADSLVGNSSNVADWNTFFDLPTYGNPFTSVQIVGNEVRLFGGSGIKVKPALMYNQQSAGLTSIIDNANCITSVGGDAFSYNYDLIEVSLPVCTIVYGYDDSPQGDYGGFGECANLTILGIPLLETAGHYSFAGCIELTTVYFPNLITSGNSSFWNCTALTSIDFINLITAGDSFYDCTSLTSVNLPNATAIGGYCFWGCIALAALDLSSCANLGTSTGNDDVFNGITGNTISLIIPSYLMTCNSGNPDGDIQYLQANNTVTITTV